MDNTIIIKKIRQISNNLERLSTPVFSSSALDSNQSKKIGIFTRDFGMSQWDWPQGVGLMGLRSEKSNNLYIHAWINERMSEGIPSKNINTTCPLYTLLDYNEYDEFCAEWAKWLVEELPRTNEKGFQHVTTGDNKNSVKLNDNEIWVDTIFMAVIFLAKAGIKFNRKDWINEAIYQLLLHTKYLFDKSNDLFFHGWSFNDRNNFSSVHWCRGNGWMTLGIPMLLSILYDYLDTSDFEYLSVLYTNQVNSLKSYQDEKYMWHTVIDNPQTYLETSGSAGIVAGVLKGIKLGLLDKQVNRKWCEKSVSALIGTIGENGVVQGVSAGTPIGETEEDYANIIIAPMAYGQALMLMALQEYQKIYG